MPEHPIERVTLTLISGARQELAEVMLYPMPPLVEAHTARRAAEMMLAEEGPVLESIGLASWSPPSEVVLDAMTAAGPSKARQAFDRRRLAENRNAEARATGRFFQVARIDGILQPLPSLWSVEHEQAVASRTILRGRSAGSRTIRYVHNGEPFVRVKTTSGDVLFISWDAVEQYQPSWARRAEEDV